MSQKGGILLRSVRGLNVEFCPNCKSPVIASEEKCPTCGDHLGAPNVRAANVPKERAALQKRYQDALERAEFRKAKDAVTSFRSAVENSIAVASCSLYVLRELAASENALYTNYYLAVRGEVRRAAESENDRVRRSVDAILFGTYADQIRFAALSLDGLGLQSYGKDGLAYGLGLKDVAIAKRASLLEENEYDFAKRHSLDTSATLPEGYRSDWESRAKLAVAKLGDSISSGLPKSEYGKVLMNNSGDRTKDQFIEIHIFGTFNINAVSSVCGTSKPKRPEEKAMIAVIKELLDNRGTKWIESD